MYVGKEEKEKSKCGLGRSWKVVHASFENKISHGADALLQSVPQLYPCHTCSGCFSRSARHRGSFISHRIFLLCNFAPASLSISQSHRFLCACDRPLLAPSRSLFSAVAALTCFTSFRYRLLLCCGAFSAFLSALCLLLSFHGTGRALPG